MAHTFIVSTPHSRVRPLHWQGIQAHSAYDQLAHLLLTRLGQSQAAILAEPVSGEEGVDWYAKAPGEPVPLTALSPDEQEKVLAGLRDFGEKTAALGAQLKQSNDSNSLLAGALLELVLSFPSDDYVYALKTEDGEFAPLLTGWGFAPAGKMEDAENILLFKTLPANCPDGVPQHPGAEEQHTGKSPAPAETNATASGQTSSGQAPAKHPLHGGAHPANDADPRETTVIRHVFPFPWALLAFLLALAVTAFVLFWLLPRLGSAGAVLPAGCTRQEAPPPETGFSREEFYRAQGREQALRTELERLRREYEMRLWMCDKQAEAEPEPVPLPELEPQPDFVPPLPELTLPELPPDPPPQPKPKPEPKPDASPQAQTETPRVQPDTMLIPDNPADLSFLEGCWYAQTGLTSSRTNMPISVKYCFDAKGNGTVSLVERNRSGRQVQECKGAAKASLNGSQLFIHDLGALCPDGNRYEKEKITCRNADKTKALCTGVGDPSGRKNWWDKPFTRTDR